MNIQIFFFTWLLMDSKQHFFRGKFLYWLFAFTKIFIIFPGKLGWKRNYFERKYFLIIDNGSASLIILFVHKTRKICKWKSIKSINFHSSSIYKTIQLSFVFYGQWLKVKNRQMIWISINFFVFGKINENSGKIIFLL